MPTVSAAEVRGAGRAIGGGRYVAHVRVGRDVRIYASLRLANDGREFADSSYVSADLECADSDVEDDIVLSSSGFIKPSVRVHSTGRFAFSEPTGDGRDRVAGRFAHNGRRVVIHVSIRTEDDDTGACPVLRRVVTAHLVGRARQPLPWQPARCDPVEVAYSSHLDGFKQYDVWEHATGCTAARDVAERWYRAPSCPHARVDGACRVRGMTCRLVRGGRFSPQASVGCTSRGRRAGAVELVRHTPCGSPPGATDSVDIRSVNLGCARALAFPFRQLEGQHDRVGACGATLGYSEAPVRCDPVAGFSCLARAEDFGPHAGYHADCTNIADPYRALEIDDDFG